MNGPDLRRAAVGVLALAWLVFALPDEAAAGTTGKIAGRIVDAKGQPLVAANVSVPLARTGAVSDADGRFVIVNVPAATYEVKFTLLGYRALTVQQVVVSADQTTTLDARLEEAPVGMAEIVVTARRPIVDVGLTSSLAALSRDEIATLPVQELQDVVNLQAGVVDGHFRGGRKGEVQFQVDGVTVNNAYDNTSVLKLDRSLLEEVQVISGTFDAEYGQAMSGVVNAVLRRGGDRFEWDAEALIGGFAYGGGARRRTDYAYEFGAPGQFVSSSFEQRDPAGVQNYQASVSGPLGVPRTTFLLSGRRWVFDDYLEAERRFRPAIGQVPDSLEDEVPPAVWKVLVPDGDGSREPLGWTREWSGVAKVTNRSIPATELSYQAVANWIRTRPTEWAFRLNPDGISRRRTFSVAHGLDATLTMSKSTFVRSSLRHNYFDYRDMLYDDVFDTRYDAAGPAVGFSAYEYGAAVQGVQFNRFRQRTSSVVLKSTFTSQYARDQQLKVGTEFEWPHIEFGSPGHLLYDAGEGLQRVENEPPHYPAVQRYRPRSAAAFGQSEVEWNSLNLRGGMRLDVFNPMATLPSDLANPANSIPVPQRSVPVLASRKVTLSPRLAISYPITRDVALFFAYGHFIQMPGLGQIYTNADYSALRDLQASSVQYDIMGNPDIRPEKTVQYQFGYRQAFSDDIGIEANTFYKDVRDLLGVEFISTYNDAEYARWTNVDFGNVLGVTVSLDQRSWGMFSSALDYTWQRAFGNSSDPRETATRAEAGQDARPRVVPFNWDQRHTLNMTVTMSRADDFSVTTVVRAASGQPYTPNNETGFDTGLATNSGRKPGSFLVDLRSEKSLRIAGIQCAAFGRVFNLLDSRFSNGVVFDTTGSPYYSRFPGFDRIALADPTRFYAPRRIELGFRLSSAGPTPAAEGS